MRVALETLDPLPFYKCWYLFEENDESTVADLRKSLNREFQLAKKSSHLKLMAGGFEYLPRFKLKSYILENDLVIVGINKDHSNHEVLGTVKKNVRDKQEHAEDEKKRTKVEKKRVEDEKKRAQDEKKREKDVKKREKDEKKRIKEQKRIERKRKRASDDEDEVVEVKKVRPVEVDGKLTRTQKRNARKKAARLREREESELTEEVAEEEDEAPTPEPVRKEDQIAPPERLLKKNKNKKANFLKEIGKKARSHFHFDPEEQEEQEHDHYVEEEEYTQKQENAYGSAIVTSVETNESYTGEKRDYDSLPVVSFAGPFPAENDHLAIKMLEMTASYTPEISDWKEVKVLSFDQAQGVLTVEFQPGFLLTEHHGKFTLRDNNQDDDDEEEEPVEEVLEDQTKQLSQFDVVDMRRL